MRGAGYVFIVSGRRVRDVNDFFARLRKQSRFDRNLIRQAGGHRLEDGARFSSGFSEEVVRFL
jgi:hypothetical protein